MDKRSVKRRIFKSNAKMILVMLVLFLLINLCFLGGYFESVEHKLTNQAGEAVDGEALEQLLGDWTIRRNEFLMLFLIDGVICITLLFVISRFFTKRLAREVMEPLRLLSEGAMRIQNNEWTEEIVYMGDQEFEAVCASFNDMQKHLLEEREKNRKYEKARTDMIAGISHDLRTPLTAIRGTIKGLLDGIAITPEQQKRFLEIAYRRAGDMDVLLNQLFYLSRLESGNMPMALQTVKIQTFVKNYGKEKQLFTEDGTIEIRVDTNDVEAAVWADPEQLARVLDNLWENSRKYAGVTPLKIDIRLSRRNGRILLRFSDNGKGVAQEKLPFVFEEFYRADEARSQKDGNGLGLYIVKYLMEKMDGNAWANNENGFAVYLELQEVNG